jgi:hypothetical protein
MPFSANGGDLGSSPFFFVRWDRATQAKSKIRTYVAFVQQAVGILHRFTFPAV